MEGGWTTQVAAGWSKDRGQQQQGEASAEKVSAEEDKAKAQHVTSLDKKAAGVAEGSKEERMDALLTTSKRLRERGKEKKGREMRWGRCQHDSVLPPLTLSGVEGTDE